ncbi:hypothetical protein DY000_02024291 [Brassica cretica]|uniref:Uncharacterized protein n=1 Tax=Brassica cretica TaxID=69181 RepID=A0ABQ7EHS5_BRACR|nr:hypothetical protein DY000_02024291 [Brassica cretica]
MIRQNAHQSTGEIIRIRQNAELDAPPPQILPVNLSLSGIPSLLISDLYRINENALFEIVKMVKAKEQVVEGTLHYRTLAYQVIDHEGWLEKLYEAEV